MCKITLEDNRCTQDKTLKSTRALQDTKDAQENIRRQYMPIRTYGTIDTKENIIRQ